MPNYKAVFAIISAAKFMNDFMIACDVFERGKVLGHLQEVTISFAREFDPTMAHAATVIPVLRQALEMDNRLVAVVSLQYIATGDMIILNRNKIPPYVNREIRIISTGKKWFMLDDYLRSEGYLVKTDEHRYIVGVG